MELNRDGKGQALEGALIPTVAFVLLELSGRSLGSQ